MQIPYALATTIRNPASVAFGLFERIAHAAQPPLSPAEPRSFESAGMLMPERVRAALLEMGVAAADADLALAEALVQMGLPLTAASLAEANGELARSPGASPQAYALAKMLALPTSPDTLRALTVVLNAPGDRTAGALPEPLRRWLGLGVEASTPPEAQARQLREILLQIGRSTENRLVSALQDKPPALPVADLRTALLRLAHASGDRSLQAQANGMASLLEGQQLLNQAGLAAHAGRPDVPLYFAIPFTFDGISTIAEVRVWAPTRTLEEDREDESALRVTIRVTPPRLGRVQANLTGRRTGSLSCRLGAEQSSTLRLLRWHTGILTEALSEAGWESCDVSCRPQSEWPPLWPGGETFTGPRTCVDRHV